MKSFNTLPLSAKMLTNLENIQYITMTAIQEESIPVILQGRDLLAQAMTGSGKTAAFGIGLLHHLKVKSFRIQAMVLCPTRELAEQVSDELRKLARFEHNIKILKLTGGMPIKNQELSLSHKAHIVVGTPGRILQLLQKRVLTLENLQTLVLDEADRMLDMGFIEQISSIMKYAPKKRQTLCFSATFPAEITQLCNEILNKPEEIRVESIHDDSVIRQQFFYAEDEEKVEAVLTLLEEYKPESTIIFCNTKDECKRLSRKLNSYKLHCLSIHGDLEQKDRTEVLVRFSNGSSRVLIATDVAARGLDINDLSAVINYELPFESETYIHRVGRTGRAGKEGLAFSFISRNEEFRLNAINKLIDGTYHAEQRTFTSSKNHPGLEPPWVTLSINGGRKQKISPGDILGALTAADGIPANEVGKIDRLDNLTFVAVKRKMAKKAFDLLQNGLIKGKSFLAVMHD
jgi:ATP-independent RNA helicase DbpA